MVIIYHCEFGVGHLVNKDDFELPALQTKDAIVERSMAVAHFPSSRSKDQYPLIDINKVFELDWTTMFRREPE